MSLGFSGFVNDKDAVMHWYDWETLLWKIEQNHPESVNKSV